MFLLRPVNWLIYRVLVPFMSWLARNEPMVKSLRDEHAAATPADYIPGDASINPVVLMAAFEDHKQMQASDPQRCQSMLNGCLEAVRGCQIISNASIQMFGALVAAGCPPDEAMMRVQANALLLGILLERRLSR